MKGIPLPPASEDFTADPVELFFDLAYVFALSQIVGLLVHHPTWGGVGEAAMLFALLWLPWQQMTWAANAVSGNGRAVRTIFLIATVVSVPMAAATPSAFDAGGAVFAVALGAIMVLGFGIQILGSKEHATLRSSAIKWMTPNLLAIVALLVGAALSDGARMIAWGVAIVIVLAAMILAGQSEWLIRIGHMAERHALIVIIALGEIIVAIGLPVVAALSDGDGLDLATIGALTAAGAFAGLMWWAYFDRVMPALEHRGEAVEGDRDRGRYVRDIYTWAHAPIVAGIVLAAAALEEVALHPESPVPTAFGVMLAGGLALTTAGVAAAIHRAFSVFPPERIVGLAAIVVWVFAGASLNGVTILAGVVALMAVTLVVEQQRIER